MGEREDGREGEWERGGRIGKREDGREGGEREGGSGSCLTRRAALIVSRVAEILSAACCAMSSPLTFSAT